MRQLLNPTVAGHGTRENFVSLKPVLSVYNANYFELQDFSENIKTVSDQRRSRFHYFYTIFTLFYIIARTETEKFGLRSIFVNKIRRKENRVTNVKILSTLHSPLSTLSYAASRASAA